MEFVPEGLVMPVAWEQNSAVTYKPVFGTIDNQYVEFYVDHRYNPEKSKLLGYEVMEPCEMCKEVNDKFSTYLSKVTDLGQFKRHKYEKLYDAFKQQKEFDGTKIERWSLLNEDERALLGHLKIMTVEQLAGATDSTRAALGPYGDELIAKAKRHVESKAEKVKSEAYAEEMSVMRREIQRLSEEAKQREEEMFKRLAAAQAAPAPKNKGGRPRKIKEESTNEMQAA